MSAEPTVKRAVAFVDGQHLFQEVDRRHRPVSARAEFDPWEA